MSRAEELMSIAAREIGYHERSGKRNKYGEWYGMDGVAWCMEFVQWCYHAAGAPLPYKTASCGALLDWYRVHDPDCVTREPVPGSIVIFDFPNTRYATDHTGLYVSRTADTLTTIDGNTSGTNQSNGGWVQQKTRSLGYANPTYITPRALWEPAAEPAEKEDEENVERYQTLDEIRAAADYAAATVEKLLQKDILRGTETGLNLNDDMLRLLVINDRAGLYS